MKLVTCRSPSSPPPSAPTPAVDCKCNMYCNYCDASHRQAFSLSTYASNGTYDLINLPRVWDDLYHLDTVNRNYEQYLDFWCDLLWDSGEMLSLAESRGEVFALAGKVLSLAKGDSM